MWGYSQDGGKIVSLFYQLESPRPPHTPPGCPATGTQAHDRSRELRSEDRPLSALPQSPTSQLSRFAESYISGHFRYRGK